MPRKKDDRDRAAYKREWREKNPRYLSQQKERRVLKDTPRARAVDPERRKQDFINQFPNWQELLPLLPESWQVIVQEYYIQGKTMDAIADERGVQKQAVHKVKSKALKKLKEISI